MPDNHDHVDPKEGFEGRTYLYIRTNPLDDGNEPLQAGLDVWKSPDINIILPNGTRTLEAIAGVTNNLEVIVNNAGGIEATDVYVDAFINDPSTVLTPATAIPVGNGYLTVPGYSSAGITFPWIPAEEYAGHRCLLARASLILPPDTYVDGSVFDRRGDRHVAQRNIHILSMKKSEAITFSFAIVNPFFKRTQMRFKVGEVRSIQGKNALRASLKCPFAQFGKGKLKKIRLVTGPERVVVPKRKNQMELLRENFSLKNVGKLKRVSMSFSRNLRSLTMAAGEIRQGVVRIERSPKTRPGDLHAVDIVQLRGRKVLGGLTLILQH